MRKFTDSMGSVLDLDNPETYSYLPQNYKEVEKILLKDIGWAHLYINYLRKDMYYNSEKDCEKNVLLRAFADQRKRIELFLDNYAKNRKDNFDNLLWIQEQAFLFQDEIDNMC